MRAAPGASDRAHLGSAPPLRSPHDHALRGGVAVPPVHVPRALSATGPPRGPGRAPPDRGSHPRHGAGAARGALRRGVGLLVHRRQVSHPGSCSRRSRGSPRQSRRTGCRGWTGCSSAGAGGSCSRSTCWRSDGTPPGGVTLLRRKDYSQIWIHQFLRVKVLRRLFRQLPASIPPTQRSGPAEGPRRLAGRPPAVRGGDEPGRVRGEHRGRSRDPQLRGQPSRPRSGTAPGFQESEAEILMGTIGAAP